MTNYAKMESKLVFQLLLLVHPHSGTKLYLVELSDPLSVGGHRENNGKDHGNWKDHGQRRDYELERYERCRGLKELCNGRLTCLEAMNTHCQMQLLLCVRVTPNVSSECSVALSFTEKYTNGEAISVQFQDVIGPNPNFYFCSDSEKILIKFRTKLRQSSDEKLGVTCTQRENSIWLFL